jgi:hypothetical protein
METMLLVLYNIIKTIPVLKRVQHMEKVPSAEGFISSAELAIRLT